MNCKVNYSLKWNIQHISLLYTSNGKVITYLLLMKKIKLSVTHLYVYTSPFTSPVTCYFASVSVTPYVFHFIDCHVYNNHWGCCTTHPLPIYLLHNLHQIVDIVEGEIGWVLCVTGVQEIHETLVRVIDNIETKWGWPNYAITINTFVPIEVPIPCVCSNVRNLLPPNNFS